MLLIYWQNIITKWKVELYSYAKMVYLYRKWKYESDVPP